MVYIRVCRDGFVWMTAPMDYWLVNFPQCGEKDDIAEISINEKDMRIIPSLNATVNEQIKEMFNE